MRRLHRRRWGESDHSGSVAQRASPSAHPVGTNAATQLHSELALGPSAFPTRTRPRTLPRCICALAVAACASALGIAPQRATARAARGASVGIGVSGGGGGGAAVTTPSPTPIPSANVIRLSGAITAQGDGISIRVAASGTLRRPLTITGQAPADHAGEEIAIQTTKLSGSHWTRAATAAIAQNGSFTATWTPSSSAQLRMRAVLAPQGSTDQSPGGGDAAGSASAAAASTVFATQALTIPIFRNAVATIFGPGLWGRHTACGERLSRALLGVASRTLKCGTRVALHYRGRELTVPVVDRGPYSAGVTWDLTMATADALGITETSTVGTLTPAPASLASLS